MKLTNSIGKLLLAIWLLLTGLSLLLGLSFQGMHLVLGALAIAAAAFLVVDK